MQAVLQLRHVSKRFPGHQALAGIDLDVRKGEFFSLLGPSGCGKTTTLRLIAGFEQPDSGSVRLNGADISQLRPWQRNVSTVFQNYALFPHLTVRGNVEFGLRRQGRTGDLDTAVARALDLVQLGGKASRYPAQLSGGERQRAALARSLVLEPDVLLLDEPLSALDPALRRQVRTELKALQRRVGITFLFVTHDQEEALSLSDRIAVMNAGRIEQVGTPEEVYLQPRTRFVASFLGSVNWIDGIGVRPEAMRLFATPPDEEMRALRATVVRSSFLGNYVQVEAEIDGGQAVTAELSRLGSGWQPGDPVHVCWRPADELRFAD